MSAAEGLQSIDRYLSPGARFALAEAIEEAEGNEVFFLGRPDESGWITDIQVHCRGNATAVPALAHVGQYGDAVIHNHPSGRLTPSEPDLQLASHFGQEGLGFFIIDNVADSIYVVVETPKERKPPIESEAVEALFVGEEGLPALLDGYEPRPGQLQMAQAVAKAQNEGAIAVLEAGTGTGKSLAYLAPSVLRALQNGERVAVSTRTRHLQSQLLTHDVPILQKLFPKLKVAVLKGRGNYLCRRKLGERRSEVSQSPNPDAEEEQFLAELRHWVEVTEDGDRDDLSFIPDHRLWELVESSTEHTLRAACPHFSECFFYNSRRRASQAQVLIVNHSLLLADLVLRAKGAGKGLLPRYDHIVLDEAHHLEDVATEFAGSSVTGAGLLRQLGRVRPARGRRKGLAVRLAEALANEPDQGPKDELVVATHELLEATEALREELRSQLSELGEMVLASAGDRPHRADATEGNADFPGSVPEVSPLSDSRRPRGAPDGSSPSSSAALLRITTELQEGQPQLVLALESVAAEMARGLTNQVVSIHKVVSTLDRMPEAFARRFLQVGLDLGTVANRLQDAAETMKLLFQPHPDRVRWIEVSRDREDRAVPRCFVRPVETTELLRQTVITGAKSLIMTSATLSVAGGFEHFLARSGLLGDPTIEERTTAAHIPSPFDYSTQVLLGVPRDLPEPGARGYEEALAEVAAQVIDIAQGRTFVLFTSYRLLRSVADRVAAKLGREFTLLRQGDLPRDRLLELFRSGSRTALFGTDSFWEGVDVRGDALSCVLITRLPFRVPTEPIQQARAERIEAMGGDPFSQLSVPQAILRFRQGFGRLIRHRSDRGVVLVLDRRVASRSYGRRFLASLPPGLRATQRPLRVLLGDVAGFLTHLQD